MEYAIQNIKFTASKTSGEVSGTLTMPENPKAVLSFAHGAGAGMNHPFMGKVSFYLADQGIGSLRYNFPYTEKKLKRPDPAPILMETIRSSIRTIAGHTKDIPIFAGGKSMGGRMSSMAAASEKSLEGIVGLIFFGFPLHAPGKPSIERGDHLYNVKIPMLFLQGTRDKLADLELLKPIIKNLRENATLYVIEGADHSFNMLKSTGKTNEEVLKELTGKVTDWITSILH